MNKNFISLVIIIGVLVIGTTLVLNGKKINSSLGTNKIELDSAVDLAKDSSDKQGEELVFIDDAENDVIVVLTKKGEVVKKIPVGHAPHDIAASPNGELVASANQDSGTVSVINTRNLTVIQTVPTGAGAHGLVFSPDGRFLYVANVTADTISVVDTALWQEIQEISVDSGPEYVGVTPDGKQIFTTNLGGSGSITLLKNQEGRLSVQKTLMLGIDPHGWAISPDGSKVVITNLGSNFTYLLNAQTFDEISHIDTGATTEFATFKDDTELWVTNIGAHYVSVVNTNQNKVLDQISVGETPHGISFSQDKTLAFVPLYGPGEVVIIDVLKRKIIKKVKVGNELHNSVMVQVGKN